MLSDVLDEDTAITWRLHLETWWHAHGHLTKERTLFVNGRWGFTHDRLRKAWLLLQRLSRDGTLFTFVAYGNPRTTSALEGGINAQIRTMLHAHRGMSEAHMKRATEWFLTIHEIPITEAHRFLNQPRPTVTNDEQHPDEDDDKEAPLYGNALTAEEGLWTRSGWLRGQ